MRIRCPNCGAKLTLREDQFANGRPSQVVCWMCNCAVGLDSLPTEPGPPTIAVPASHERSRGSGLEGSLNSQTASLALPQDEVITISVVSGLSQGMEFELSTPLVTIGRLGGGADIEIDDSEVSRSHCAIEVRPTRFCCTICVLRMGRISAILAFSWPGWSPCRNFESVLRFCRSR